MPSIDLRQSHQLPLAEARARVEHVADRMREKFAMDSRWDGDTLRFSRSGVKGVIAVTAQEVTVHAELGLMLSPLKGMVEDEIRRKLAEHLA
jgi:putative polyhydroxyalkanoate system protein